MTFRFLILHCHFQCHSFFFNAFNDFNVVWLSAQLKTLLQLLKSNATGHDPACVFCDAKTHCLLRLLAAGFASMVLVGGTSFARQNLTAHLYQHVLHL